MPCPFCGRSPRGLFRSRRDIEDELSLRARLFHPALRDVTDATLATPAAIFRCETCGILIRETASEDVFRDDAYSSAELRLLHDVHAEAFRRKARDYRPLLPPRARVVEIGSYAGGFLRAASEWGWRVTGIDIGGDTSRFTRALGFEMRDDIGECDAAFIWNCFEQIYAPKALLRKIAAALPDDGILVVRVPDAAFYAAADDLRALAYSGLLGWPHRFGYDVAALARLAAEHGFELRRVLRRGVVWPLREQLMEAAPIGWIELTFVKSRAAEAA